MDEGEERGWRGGGGGGKRKGRKKHVSRPRDDAGFASPRTFELALQRGAGYERSGT